MEDIKIELKKVSNETLADLLNAGRTDILKEYYTKGFITLSISTEVPVEACVDELYAEQMTKKEQDIAFVQRVSANRYKQGPDKERLRELSEGYVPKRVADDDAIVTEPVVKRAPIKWGTDQTVCITDDSTTVMDDLNQEERKFMEEQARVSREKALQYLAQRRAAQATKDAYTEERKDMYAEILTDKERESKLARLNDLKTEQANLDKSMVETCERLKQSIQEMKQAARNTNKVAGYTIPEGGIVIKGECTEEYYTPSYLQKCTSEELEKIVTRYKKYRDQVNKEETAKRWAEAYQTINAPCDDFASARVFGREETTEEATPDICYKSLHRAVSDLLFNKSPETTHPTEPPKVDLASAFTSVGVNKPVESENVTEVMLDKSSEEVLQELSAKYKDVIEHEQEAAKECTVPCGAMHNPNAVLTVGRLLTLSPESATSMFSEISGCGGDTQLLLDILQDWVFAADWNRGRAINADLTKKLAQ